MNLGIAWRRGRRRMTGVASAEERVDLSAAGSPIGGGTAVGTATVPGAVVASFDDHTGDAPTVPTAVDELTCELADGTTWTLHGRVVAAARDGRDF